MRTSGRHALLLLAQLGQHDTHIRVQPRHELSTIALHLLCIVKRLQHAAIGEYRACETSEHTQQSLDRAIPPAAPGSARSRAAGTPRPRSRRHAAPSAVGRARTRDHASPRRRPSRPARLAPVHQPISHSPRVNSAILRRFLPEKHAREAPASADKTRTSATTTRVSLSRASSCSSARRATALVR